MLQEVNYGHLHNNSSWVKTKFKDPNYPSKSSGMHEDLGLKKS